MFNAGLIWDCKYLIWPRNIEKSIITLMGTFEAQPSKIPHQSIIWWFFCQWKAPFKLKSRGRRGRSSEERGGCRVALCINGKGASNTYMDTRGRSQPYSLLQQGTSIRWKRQMAASATPTLDMGQTPQQTAEMWNLWICRCWQIYRARKKGLYVVARNFFLLLLNCSAWPCPGTHH